MAFDIEVIYFAHAHLLRATTLIASFILARRHGDGRDIFRHSSAFIVMIGLDIIYLRSIT